MAGIELKSSAFNDGAFIPRRYAKEGDDVSPDLTWTGVPDGTSELLLLCEDPDAPSGTFVHWLVTGIDPACEGVAAGEIPPGGQERRNGYGDSGWGGPNPPPRRPGPPVLLPALRAPRAGVAARRRGRGRRTRGGGRAPARQRHFGRPVPPLTSYRRRPGPGPAAPRTGPAAYRRPSARPRPGAAVRAEPGTRGGTARCRRRHPAARRAGRGSGTVRGMVWWTARSVNP